MSADNSGLLDEIREFQKEMAILRQSLQLIKNKAQSSDTVDDTKAEEPKPKRRGRPPKVAKPDAEEAEEPKPKRRGRPPKPSAPAGMPPRPQGRGRMRKNAPKKPARRRGRPRKSKL